MNKIELMYKADTDIVPKIGIEIEHSPKTGSVLMDDVVLQHFDDDGDVIEFYTPEYVAWLEEKVEQLSPKQ